MLVGCKADPSCEVCHGPLRQASEVWARVRSSEKARAVLCEELLRALDAPPASLVSMGVRAAESLCGGVAAAADNLAC